MIAQAVAEVPPDDAELARRIGQRDERAFEAMMRRHNLMLYRLARSKLKEEAVTSRMLGCFRDNTSSRQEFLTILA